MSIFTYLLIEIDCFEFSYSAMDESSRRCTFDVSVVRGLIDVLREVAAAGSWY